MAEAVSAPGSPDLTIKSPDTTSGSTAKWAHRFQSVAFSIPIWPMFVPAGLWGAPGPSPNQPWGLASLSS